MASHPRKKAVAPVAAFPREATPADVARTLNEAHRVLAHRAKGRAAAPTALVNPYRFTEPPPGVPKNASLALDASLKSRNDWASAQHDRLAMDNALLGAAGGVGIYGQAWANGYGFLGYGYLSQLAQVAEYRIITTTISEEMTREWIEFESTAHKDRQQLPDEKAARLDELQDWFDEHDVKSVFKALSESDGYLGRGHLYLDTGDSDDAEELLKPIGNGRDSVSKAKVTKDRPLRRVAAIEATWCYPTDYNADNPLKPDWYKPRTWFAMGNQINTTRLIPLVGQPLPDLLKPLFNFGGLSLSQMAKPYVDNWLRTRQACADMVWSFSTNVLKTNLQTLLQDPDGLLNRVNSFNAVRNNNGTLVVDKDSEDWANVTTPIAGLHELQAQAQEHMFSVSKIPGVKFAGIQPSGLNASSEGEIRVFYDTIHARQEFLFRGPLTTVMHFAMLSLWGEIDREITFKFKPLWQLDEAAQAAVQLTKAQVIETDVAAGLITPEEGRQARAADPDSPYQELDLEDSDVEAPGEYEELEQLLSGGSEKGPIAPKPQTETSGRLARSVEGKAAEFGGPATGGFSSDKRFTESEHPRDQKGRFSEASTHGAGGRRREGGGKLPLHIEALKIPPAWTDVRFNEDPNGSLLVVGVDGKGRRQAIYSLAHGQRAAAAKFARIKEMSQKFAEIQEENLANAKSDDPRTKDSAEALNLIMKMGLRPGSENDTRAKEKAYGATTLEGRHVVEDDAGNLWLRFVGKKGVRISLPVSDRPLADFLRKRSQEVGQDGKLFPHTNSSVLLNYVHTLDGGGFKSKDFRTHLGTTLALRYIEERNNPTTMAEYKKAVLDVAKRVSQALGNTPTVALQSYIAPEVFSEWRAIADDRKG